MTDITLPLYSAECYESKSSDSVISQQLTEVLLKDKGEDMSPRRRKRIADDLQALRQWA